MNDKLRDDLLTGLIFQSFAEKYYEYVKEDVSGEGKLFINRLLNRLSANRNDCYTRVTTHEGREAFHKEFSRGDVLQYGNVVLDMMEMSQDKKDLAERTIAAIKKGAKIDFLDTSNS